MRKRPPPRTVEVFGKEQLTPNMLRVTLGGPGLEGLSGELDGAYIKLRLSGPRSDDESALVRTYTIRHFDPASLRMDVDFVVHEAEGPAADWARSCALGDTIRMGGPGPCSMVDHSADWFLLVGDMSALPAISANIESMAADAQGHALLEIIDESDRQELKEPPGLKIDWFVNPHPGRENTFLLDAVKAVDWRTGRPYVWVAGEFSQSLAIRSFLKSERGITREHMYASSYWQIGQTEDGHRVSKRSAGNA